MRCVSELNVTVLISFVVNEILIPFTAFFDLILQFLYCF